MPDRDSESLFPPGCKCLSYGLKMTRVVVSYCPYHGTNATLKDKEALRAARLSGEAGNG